ncbi:ATP-binding protein [Methylomicrobium agile]|uniref:ATP-binding protein n=1 Tax=Methylomicrobium agile TaxID=39774 RepID=UPI0004DF98AF|nr:ATP-binding protein [Methylomicrobium agile]
MNEITQIADLYDCGAIRLRQLSVYNWGSFHGLHTAAIDPDGTLITGDNGAGKSTLVDALMALLQPAGKAAFNVAAAQGDRSDRSLMSYVRGSFGSAHDGSQTRVRSKREGAVVTGLCANYAAEDGAEMALAALFWITHAGGSLGDLKRVYLVARRKLALKELLDAFGDGDPRALKNFLKDDPAITNCDDRFSEYLESYRRLLRMDNPNAPALLARALGLKKIDDLTALIRELVLEPSGVREDARKAVGEFADLVGIHERLLDARRQRDALAELPAIEKDLFRAESELKQLDAELQGLPVWFGEQCAALWAERVERIEDRLRAAKQVLAKLEQEVKDAESNAEQRHADYLQAGGERIEAIKKDLSVAEDKLRDTTRRAADYQQIAGALQLDKTLQEAVFARNRQQAANAIEQIEQEKTQAQDAFAEQAAKFSNAQQQQRDLQEEIRAIEARPDSNIDSKFQQLRDEMAEALGLAREQLVFFGELLDVKDEERAWQGAIERALGGLRTTLAVPEGEYPLVTRWLNQRHTGLHVRAQVVRASNDKATFKTNGYLRKLAWREHPYRDWLKQHLAHFDLDCVASTEALDRTPFSLTQQGLMHLEKGRFEKKDQQRIDDRRAWQLGFSNKNRLDALKQEAKALAEQLGVLDKAAAEARTRLDEVGKRSRQWEKLGEFRWAEIDAPYWQGRTGQLQNDIRQLEQAGGDLAKAKARWDEAKQALQQLQTKQGQQIAEVAGIGKDRQSAAARQEQAQRLAAAGLGDDLRAALRGKTGALQDEQLDDAAKIEERHRRGLEQQRDAARGRKDRAGRSAIGIMTGFRAKWEALTAEWGADLASLSEYLHHLGQLEKDGLPALVEEFQKRLNKHTTQSLAAIRQRIDSEREEIHERIETINRVLARTEFKAGSFLRLGIQNDQYEHVLHFNRLLRQVMEQLTGDDHEARFAVLQQVIEILDKASSSASAYTLESLRLLDPRHQLSFYAEEIGLEDGAIRDVLKSSSGKSGGEKESFAGTIVAASLAYVLTPDGYDRPVYSTVFLDEAFSNTAEAVSRRVLRIFKELHIHVNLITPYKNLNLARESARSLIIAERDGATHESRLCEVTWEEIDRRLQRQAGELDIVLAPET